MFKRTVVAIAALAVAGASWGYQSSGGRVRDDAGNPVQLRGLNWFGFETSTNVVHGLWARNWRDQIAQMKNLGFNAVRLPFCPTTLRGGPPSSINYSLNPDLANLSALQVMDKMVRELSNQGFYVLLDHHSPDCNTITELWYTPSYSEQQWLADLELVAQLFASVPGVIGIDLKNEPHGAATWGTGRVATDWNLAAERASARVLAVAPHWLMFVEGIDENPNCSSQWGHGWGGSLEAMRCTPLNIPAKRLVLAPHAYGPDVYVQPYFSAGNFPYNMPAIWDQHFGQYVQTGYTVMLGEFGGKYGEADARDKTWQQAMVAYLVGKGINSGFYWSWNPNSGDTGGILRDDWTTVRQDKMALLQTLWAAPASAATPTPAPVVAAPAPAPVVAAPAPAPVVAAPAPAPVVAAPAPAPAPAPASTQFKTKTVVDADWGAGYCSHTQVTNTGSTAGAWRVSMPIEGRINDLWNAVWTQSSGGALTVQGPSWATTLAPGSMAEFGFCAVR